MINKSYKIAHVYCYNGCDGLNIKANNDKIIDPYYTMKCYSKTKNIKVIVNDQKIIANHGETVIIGPDDRLYNERHEK